MKSINKTNSIRTKIFRAILRGEFVPGEKLPTEREMGTMTQSSRVTVRRAYQQLEESKILQRIQGRGTFVTSHSEGNQEKCQQVALLTAINDDFALRFVREVETVLTSLDILLVLRITDDLPAKEEEAAIDLVGKGINNLIIWPTGNALVTDTFRRLRVLGTNMVFFDRIIPRDFADYVGVDNIDVMNKLFMHAEKNNLTHPLFFTHRNLKFDSNQARIQAFIQNCQTRNLPYSIIDITRQQQLTELPLTIDSNNTIFCVNDEVAEQIKPFVNQLPVYSIDGFSDYAVSYQQPIKAMAQLAVKLLLKQQQKGSKWRAEKHFLKGKLINV